ncbi:MAG: hypothetical protein JSR19_04315 [Proteobacteria bacterium]|nr:hypothetical protein [Pseudomonadota bacterium]HQR04249.1 hypothetical protein [Rhodocyclaceae bacterium]
MLTPPGAERDRLVLALALSAVVHVLVLLLRIAAPASPATGAAGPSRFDATLEPASRTRPMTVPTPSTAVSPRVTREHRVLTAPGVRSNWSVAEKDEMDRFLQDLSSTRQPAPPSLEQRSLAAARALPDPETEPDPEQAEIARRLKTARVEPFSLEMYFDAVFRKMNRSAAMVVNRSRKKGRHAAAVRIALNADGSLDSFRILRTADQQDEIDYIRTVVERAVPFPRFPQDIRNATGRMVVEVCILPGAGDDPSGAVFSHMEPGQRCRDP